MPQAKATIYLPINGLKPAFSYGRVSDDDHQDKLLTIDTQLGEAAAAAAKHGFYIAKTFRETGTATNDSRAQYQLMIGEAIAPGSGIKAIWFYDQSRFVRDEFDFYHYTKVLTDHGVQLGSARDGLYGKDEYSRMSWGFRALMYASFSRDVAKRTRDMQFGAVREGFYIAPHTPFGYEKYKVAVGIKERTKLKPHPVQWVHALKMMEMALDKSTPMTIAHYMNSIGVLTNEGNLWTRDSVLEFLRNPTNTGKTYRGLRQNSKLIPNDDDMVVCEGAHEAMITPEQYDRIKGYIAERASTDGGTRSYSSPNLLSKRTECEHCGSPMVVQPSRQGRKLRCRKKKNFGAAACVSRNIPLDIVLSTILQALLDHILTRETLEQQIKAVAQENQRFLLEQQTKRADLQKNATDINRQIKNLVKGVAETGGSKSIYASLKKHESQLEQANAELQEIDAIMGDHLDFLNRPELIISNALDVRTYLESDDPQIVRNFLGSFIKKVTIDNQWKGTIYYTIPLPSDTQAAQSMVQSVRFEKKDGENKRCLYEALMTMMFCRF